MKITVELSDEEIKEAFAEYLLERGLTMCKGLALEWEMRNAGDQRDPFMLPSSVKIAATSEPDR